MSVDLEEVAESRDAEIVLTVVPIGGAKSTNLDETRVLGGIPRL